MNTLIPGRWEHKPEAELESRACLVQGRPARVSKPLAFAVLIATAMVLMGGFQGQPFVLNGTSHARDHLYQ